MALLIWFFIAKTLLSKQGLARAVNLTASMFMVTQLTVRFMTLMLELPNHFIEQINRVGNGYSFSRLRAKALYWHLAAPRVTYSMTTKKMAVPVLGLYTGKGHMSSNIEKYETVYGIFESDEEQPKRPPVSMLSYYQKYHNESDE